MIGACEGLILRYVGMLGMPDGSMGRAALIAACTSRAASLRSRSRLNISSIVVAPWRLCDDISRRPGVEANARSSGVATLLAIVSGLAPGSEACTAIAGKSTSGSGATGSNQ
jgi:hypothetical protein